MTLYPLGVGRYRKQSLGVLSLVATTTTSNTTVPIARVRLTEGSIVNWGDGNSEVLQADTDNAPSHVYATAGTYPVVVEKAKKIVSLRLETALLGRLNTAQLADSQITYFYVGQITNSVINSADMIDWRPITWYLYSMPTGTYSINSADMIDWRPMTWILVNMPTGTYIINSADLVDWRPIAWYLYSMPTGTYSINSADMVNWRPLYVYVRTLSGYTPTITTDTIRYWTPTATLDLQNNGFSQAMVDAVLLDIYNGRMGYTATSPTLNIGGTNSAPSGIYQDATPPTTGKEYAYKLINDPDGEGFKKWAITYTT